MKISLEAFIALSKRRLDAFETHWERELRQRSPDETPIDANFASEEKWDDRLFEAKSDGKI